MTRYCVNATVEMDAWVYVEADTSQDALAAARNLNVSEFEFGDPVGVEIVNAERDE